MPTREHSFLRPLAVLAALPALLTACGDTQGPDLERPPPVVATADVFPPASVAVPGGTIQLAARAVGPVENVLPGYTFTWSSSDPSVAEVDSEGRIRGNTIGRATITAVSRDLSATATVDVVDENFTEIQASGGYTCGILAGGKAVCWGDNHAGHLGAGYQGDGLRLESSLPPVPVAGGLSFATLGSHLIWHTCGTTTDGVAYCWGLDEYTALGAATSETCENQISGNRFGCSSTPLRVNTQVRFDWASAFWDHSCGLTSAGEAYCWGDNTGGVLGVPGGERDSPAAVNTSLRFKSLAGTAHNTCGVAMDGTGSCWGLSGLAAKGPGEVDGFEPISIPGLAPLESLTGGRWHICGLATDGRAFCWGVNHKSQLGAASQDICTVNVSTDCSFTPQEVTGGYRFTELSAGSSFTCGLTTAGSVRCWGATDDGALGVNPAVGPSVLDPVLVPGGHDFVTIDAGYVHVCGVTVSGAVYCWGDNRNLQLGAETERPWSAEPVRVFGPR